MRQLDVSISKFIADMHVEIWWSRKICFYTNAFSSVQLRSFLYLDAHVQPSSLQHIFPLGLNYATHPTPSFQLKQSAIHQLYTDNFKTRVKLNLRGKKKKKKSIKFLLSVGEVDFQFRLRFFWNPIIYNLFYWQIQISCNNHVFLHRVLSQFPCFQSTMQSTNTTL